MTSENTAGGNRAGENTTSGNTAGENTTSGDTAGGNTDQRERLAARQADLLRALLADGPPPPGFAPAAVAVEAAALLAKRRRVVAHLAPDLTGDLGERFPPLFEEYARANPRRAGSRAREDAAAFERWLTDRGNLAGPRRPWWRLGRAGDRARVVSRRGAAPPG